MTYLITILAMMTLGIGTIFGMINARATRKRLEELKVGARSKSSLSEDGIRERRAGVPHQRPD